MKRKKVIIFNLYHDWDRLLIWYGVEDEDARREIKRAIAEEVEKCMQRNKIFNKLNWEKVPKCSDCDREWEDKNKNGKIKIKNRLMDNFGNLRKKW